MIPFLSRILGLLLSLSAASAQFVAYKTLDGIVVLSQKPGRFFTLEIPGKTVQPVGQGEDLPRFRADGRFVQLVSASLKQIGGDAAMDDKTLLRKQMAYDAGYYKTPLAKCKSEDFKLENGTDALFWSFTPKIPGYDKVPLQIFLTFHSGDYVMVIGSSLDAEGVTLEEVKSLLVKIANSYRKYDRMMELQFKPDGTYTPEPATKPFTPPPEPADSTGKAAP